MRGIADQQELAEEISIAISKPVGFGEELDEDELLAELALEQEELDKNVLQISGPATVPLANVPALTLTSNPTCLHQVLPAPHMHTPARCWPPPALNQFNGSSPVLQFLHGILVLFLLLGGLLNLPPKHQGRITAHSL